MINISTRLTGFMLKSMTVLAALVFSGCVSSPTYGTGTTANSQLMEDLSSSFSFMPKQGATVAYQPRPEVLKDGVAKGLPAPQENVTKTAGVWPESPEQKRARLRQEATDAQGDPTFVPSIQNDSTGLATAVRGSGNPNDERDARKHVVEGADLSARVKAARVTNATGSPTKRATLSEPPLDYRQPATTAAYGDVGEDESKKERRLRAEAKKGKSGKSFRDYIPWL